MRAAIDAAVDPTRLTRLIERAAPGEAVVSDTAALALGPDGDPIAAGLDRAGVAPFDAGSEPVWRLRHP